MPAKTIECWFDFASNYSYLSVMRIEQLAVRHGIDVRWRPFLLGPIFKSLGWNNSPFVLQQAKGRYVWQDMHRQCERRGLPWRQPSDFPRRQLLPTRVALLMEDQPWIGTFCQRIMTQNFAEDRDIDNEAVVREALDGFDVSIDDLLLQATDPATKQKLMQRTTEAQCLGIFGAPTFFVGDAMYWGNDRLDQAIEDLAASQG